MVKRVSHGRRDSTRHFGSRDFGARRSDFGARRSHSAHFEDTSARAEVSSKSRIVLLLFCDVSLCLAHVQKKKSKKYDRITVEISSTVSHERHDTDRTRF